MSELRSSATLAWREESGRAVRAEAKAEVVMGIVVVGAVVDNIDDDEVEGKKEIVWLLMSLLVLVLDI